MTSQGQGHSLTLSSVSLSSHLSPLTSVVVGAPQITLQQYLSTIPCLPLRESPNSMSVYSLMLSSHLFFCLPLRLAPVPFRIVFAMLQDLEMWTYHLSFRFFTMVRRSSCTPIAFWILLRTSTFVTRFL